MAHRYGLYYDLQAQCACCRRMEWFKFKSRHDQVVCPACIRHLGDQPSRVKVRDIEHTKWWVEDVTELKESHRAVVAAADDRRKREVGSLEAKVSALNEQVSDLEGAMLRELESRPVESIALWFEQTKIAEADERTTRARGYIKHLYRVLWHVAEAHHVADGDRDSCSCGLGCDDCQTLAALNPIQSSLNKWEIDELQRMKDGRQHSLPHDHPEVTRHEPWRARRGA